MNNYKLTIQYDGTNYSGWQIQDNSNTIQQTVTDKIKILIKEKVNVIGSGRTDSGVHALGQAANFRTECEIDIYKFKHSLNAILPNDISILEMEKTDEKFHARFDARKRTYLYFITNFKSPFFLRYSYFYSETPDCSKLNILSKVLLGEKDFSSFARKNTETNNKICNIYEARWKEINGMLIFRIEADRFLHGMVRTIVGTLLKTGKMNCGEDYITEILLSGDREKAGEAAPSNGLFLSKVKY